MTCAGPYTRVFHTKADSKRARGFISRLKKMDLTPVVTAMPTGLQGLEDYSFDLMIAHNDHQGDTTWTLRMAKFIGPKTFWKQSYVFEVSLQQDGGVEGVEGGDSWKASLFATTQQGAFNAFTQAWGQLSAGVRDLPGLVPYLAAHERRIELCNGITL